MTKSAIITVNDGFTTDDATEFFVGFTFESGGGERTYGYRIAVNDGHHCTIVEESQTLGEKLISIGEETEETKV